MAFNEALAAAWCRNLARTLQVQKISPNGTPYLERYFAAGWTPYNKRKGPAIFLHRFVASDPDDFVHSHPWGWSASLILSGGYREQRCSEAGEMTEREYRAGDVNVLEPDVKHRVDLLGSECWTLFLAGNFEQQWEFAPICSSK